MSSSVSRAVWRGMEDVRAVFDVLSHLPDMEHFLRDEMVQRQ